MTNPAATSNHLADYAENGEYAQFLSGLPLSSYGKYLSYLMPSARGRVLDVGCGVGQVVDALAGRGHDAFGVDACAPALDIARRGRGTFALIQDESLPFDDASFDAVGCYTVLEHVAEPERMLSDMVRVLKPGGTVVVACPNFLRVAGLGAHHWHTRGVRRKVLNASMLLKKGVLARTSPQSMRFERMEPIVRPDHFEPDDDAIVVTNPIDVGFFLRRSGVRIVHRSGALVSLGRIGDHIASLPLVRTVIGGTFIVGRKS